MHDADVTSQGASSRVLILDLDGTTLSSSGVLEQKTAAAIRRAAERGIHVVFASARPLWSMRELTAAVHSAHYIAAGGAVVADPEASVLVRWPLAGEGLRRAIDLLDEEGVSALLYRDELTMRYGDSPAIRAEGLLTAKGRQLDVWDEGPVDKLLAIADDPSPLLSELERAPVSATTSHASHVEVTAAGIDKAVAAEFVLQRLHAGWEGVTALGDGDNDVCLLRKASNALTVSGASPAAREAADRIIGTNDDGGVARIIEGLTAIGMADRDVHGVDRAN